MSISRLPSSPSSSTAFPSNVRLHRQLLLQQTGAASIPSSSHLSVSPSSRPSSPAPPRDPYDLSQLRAALKGGPSLSPSLSPRTSPASSPSSPSVPTPSSLSLQPTPLSTATTLSNFSPSPSSSHSPYSSSFSSFPSPLASLDSPFAFVPHTERRSLSSSRTGGNGGDGANRDSPSFSFFSSTASPADSSSLHRPLRLRRKRPSGEEVEADEGSDEVNSQAEETAAGEEGVRDSLQQSRRLSSTLPLHQLPSSSSFSSSSSSSSSPASSPSPFVSRAPLPPRPPRVHLRSLRRTATGNGAGGGVTLVRERGQEERVGDEFSLLTTGDLHDEDEGNDDDEEMIGQRKKRRRWPFSPPHTLPTSFHQSPPSPPPSHSDEEKEGPRLPTSSLSLISPLDRLRRLDPFIIQASSTHSSADERRAEEEPSDSASSMLLPASHIHSASSALSRSHQLTLTRLQHFSLQ